MHTNNIELLRDEAQRLLQLNIEGLGQMMAAKGVITEAKEGSQQTFDRTSTPKYIEVLKGELTKLENMELVIAVVGTMKAGKSTTINAIVGTEVLPNRNRPMTALPTLIRHTPGQIEPILKFENNEPINTLFEKLRVQIISDTVNEKLQNLSADCNGDKPADYSKKSIACDMKELIDHITNRLMFSTQYQGAINICWFLKMLNDLVRLSNELGIEFPFSSYSNVEQMPIIEVEFVHLREVGETHGQLTLLDTPGPNEAGQHHLRDMLTEQLRKASAVLAVFDYTQLQSDADAQVREEIKNIAKLHQERLFALVNKFDQKDSNGDGKESVQTLVANTLMGGLLDKKHVFPVSSNWGYLANRAGNEIAINGRLPDSKKVPWVSDFKKAALASCADDDMPDITAALKNPSILWEKSGFGEPMENIIRAAHTKAALLSIESATAKLFDSATDMRDFLEIRKNALKKDTEQLIGYIKELKSKIEKIKEIDQSVKNDLSKLHNDFEESIKVNIDECKKKVNTQIDIFISTSKHSQWKGINNDGSLAVAEKNDDVLNMLNKMTETIEEKAANQISKVEADIDKMVAGFRGNFIIATESSKKILLDMNEYFMDEGFSLKTKLPNVDGINLTFKVSTLIENKIRHDVKKKTYRVEKNGWWSLIARKINDSWGYEERKRDVSSYSIDFEEIKINFSNDIDSNFSEYKAIIDNVVIKPLIKSIDEFFIEFTSVIKNMQGDFQQSIYDKEQNRSYQCLLMRNLENFSGEYLSFFKDSELLKADIDNLKNGRVIV